MGAIASLAAGYAAARLAHRPWAAVAVGVAITALFVPIHYGLGDRVPVWYHLTFLLSIVPLTMLGGRVEAGSPASVAGRYTGGAPA